MTTLAFDCESEVIPDRTFVLSRSGRRVYTSPFCTPRVVLGTVARDAGSEVEVHTPDSLRALLLEEARRGMHLVGHNVPFDLDVLWPAGLPPEIVDALNEGRVHDTKLLDVLVGLAEGRYDTPVYNPATKTWAQPEVLSASLEELARAYAGMELDKNPTIRLGFGQFLGRPLADIPSAFLEYAKKDALATLQVFEALQQRQRALGIPGDLSEPIQVRAAIVYHELDKRGIGTDCALAAKMSARLDAELRPLELALAEIGLGRWEPRPGTIRRNVGPANCGTEAGVWYQTPAGLERIRVLKKGPVLDRAEPAFHLTTAAVQLALSALTPTEPVPLRPEGGISLDYDFWVKHVPHENHPLQTWLAHEKIKKILNTYLSLYQRVGAVYPRWHVLGARSGRSSASGPSIQNVPKRRHGIRALFTPSPGHVFVRADYSAQEMYTLAEVLCRMGLRGPLYDVLASGQDIHRVAAGLVLEKDPTTVTKDERQGQKALNFGVPGGLGPKKLSEYAYGLYGLKWTVDEARARRDAFLRAFPDIAEYLRRLKPNTDALLRQYTGAGLRGWAEQLDCPRREVLTRLRRSGNIELVELADRADRSLTVHLPTGRVRARCRFTEGANTYFQGLAADVTKQAVWLSHCCVLRVVMVVHDEIVVECEPALVDITKMELRECMLTAFKQICPHVGHLAGVEVDGPLERWGIATDGQGKEIVDAAS